MWRIFFKNLAQICLKQTCAKVYILYIRLIKIRFEEIGIRTPEAFD